MKKKIIKYLERLLTKLRGDDVVVKAEVYSFDELFELPYQNPNLFYPKVNSKFYQTMRRKIEGKYLGSSTITYLPQYTVFLPIKEYYLSVELEHIINLLDSIYLEDTLFGSEVEGKPFFRMIKDSRTGMLVMDLFIVHSYGN